jgi:hypothetical protein
LGERIPLFSIFVVQDFVAFTKDEGCSGAEALTYRDQGHDR